MGSVQKQLSWVFYFIPVVIVLFAFILVVVGALSKGVSVGPNVENNILESQLLYSPNCFAYKDDLTGRVYNSYIDIKKFNENVFQNCMPFKNNFQRGMMVVLSVPGKNEIELASENFKRKLEVSRVNNDRPVNVVFEDGKILPGKLSIVHWYSE